MNFVSIDSIAFSLPGYPLSYIEIVATVAGLISVFLATHRHLWTWPFGMVNQIGFFLMFYQLQLYANLLLQAYYFVVTVYGWHHWHTSRQEGKIIRSSQRLRHWMLVIVVAGSLALGFIVQRVHLWMPELFTQQAAYPYLDATVTVAGMLAMWLMAHRRIECWWLWIGVDTLSIYLYFRKEVILVTIEYVVFLLLAVYGLWQWRRRLA
jgi:nicotinamide mononucleotide transporter